MSCTSNCSSHEFFYEDNNDLPILPTNNEYSQPGGINMFVQATLLWDEINVIKIKQCYVYHQLLLSYTVLKNNPEIYVVTLCKLIKMSYRDNKFSDCIRYFKTLWRIISSMRIVLDICTLRICGFLIFYSRIPQCMVIDLFQSQQSFDGNIIDVRQNDKNEITKLRSSIFRKCLYLYTDIRLKLPGDAIKTYYEVTKSFVELWENGRERAPECFAKLYDIYGYLGHYHWINKLDPVSGYKYFMNPVLDIIKNKDFSCVLCSDSLCINKNILLYLFCIFLTFGIFDYKMAYYMFKIALKNNPLDPALILHYGIFLMHCGKYQKALKYIQKSNRINPDACLLQMYSVRFSSNKSYCEHAKDKIKSIGKSVSLKEIECWYDRCFHCQKQMKRMKRCKICRIASYCSRKCQKFHWINHRTQCKPKKFLTIYDRMHYYLLRDYNLL